MRTVIKTLLVAALLVAATACGSNGGGDGGGVDADLTTPLAEVQEEANKLDKAALEEKAAGYEAYIKDKTAEYEGLMDQAKEALGDQDPTKLLDEGVKEAVAMKDKYEEMAAEVMKDIDMAKERLNIYTQQIKMKTEND